MGGYSERKSISGFFLETILETLETDIAPYAGQAVFVIGFIGGVSFATLAFVLQAWQEFAKPANLVLFSLTGRQFFDILTAALGATSAVSGVDSIILAGIASRDPTTNRTGKAVGLILLPFAIMGILIAIPLLVLPFSHVAFYTLAVFDLILLGLLLVSVSPPPSKGLSAPASKPKDSPEEISEQGK
jgi:hypothetical protein